MPGLGYLFGARTALLPSRPSYDAAARTASGRAPAGAAVSVLLDGTALGTATADAQGRWSFAFGTASVEGRTITARSEVTSPGLAVPAGAVGALTLTNNSVPVGSAAGTVFGTIEGGEAGSTYSVLPNDGRFAIASGNRLAVGLSAHTAGVYDISIVETLAAGGTRTTARKVAFRARPTADWAVCTRSETVAAKNAFDAWLGAPTQMVHLFAETANGASTWAENLDITKLQLNRFAGTGTRFDIAFPGCSTSQPLSETVAGTHDAIIRQIFVELANGITDPWIFVRPLWEGQHISAYPHNGTSAAGRDALYIAAFRRIMQIAWTVDHRFIAGFITFGGAVDHLGSPVTFDRLYPGDDVVDVIGTDPYLAETPLPGGTNDVRAAYNKRKLVCGLDECITQAIVRGKMVAIPEHAITADDQEYYLHSVYMRLWESGVGVTHIGYWNKGLKNQDEPFACRLDNNQHPRVVARFKRLYGPLQWVTPSALTATTNNNLDLVLETSRPAVFTITGGTNAALFEITGTSLTQTQAIRSKSGLAAGSYSVTVRATPKNGQPVDQTFTITVANGMLAPETYVVRSRYATAPTTGFSTALSNLHYALKAAGVYKRLDALYLLRNGTKQAALLNVMSGVDYNMTEVGAPVFTANEGIQGNGANAKLDLNLFASLPGLKLNQDDFYFGIWSLTDLPNGSNRSYDFGGNSGAHWIARDTSSGIAIRPGAAATKGVSGGSFPGYASISRTGAAAWAAHTAGAQRVTGTDASAVLPHFSLEALAGGSSQNQWGVNKLAAVVVGKSMTQAQDQAIYNALNTFVGATLT